GNERGPGRHARAAGVRSDGGRLAVPGGAGGWRAAAGGDSENGCAGCATDGAVGRSAPTTGRVAPSAEGGEARGAEGGQARDEPGSAAAQRQSCADTKRRQRRGRGRSAVAKRRQRRDGPRRLAATA